MIVDVKDINLELEKNCLIKKQEPYIILLPITRKIVPIMKWEADIVRILNEVTSISEAEKIIQEYMLKCDGKLPFNSSKEILIFLEEKGIIRYTLSKNVKYHTDFINGYYFDYINNPLPHHQIKEPELNNFKISLTEDCIQYCSYCYYTENKKAKRKKMTEKVLCEAIDFILNMAKYKKIKKVIISWWGGDPVHAVDMLEKGVEYANKVFEQADIKLKYNICSSFVDEEKVDRVIRLIKVNNMDVTLSCDGYREIHNEHRRLNDSYDGITTSYDVMEKSRLKLLADTYLFTEQCEIMKRKRKGENVITECKNIKNRYRIKQRCTIYNEKEIENYDKLCDYFDQFNIPYRISLATCRNNLKSKKIFEDKVHKKIKLAQKMIIQNYPNDIINIKSIFLNMNVNPIDGINFCYSRCGFGGGESIISTEGEIFSCHRFCDIEDFCLGTIWDAPQFIEEKCSVSRRRWLCEFEPCNSCKKLPYCSGGGCAHEAYTYYGTEKHNAGCISIPILKEKARLYYIFVSLYDDYDTNVLNLEDGSFARYCWYY